MLRWKTALDSFSFIALAAAILLAVGGLGGAPALAQNPQLTPKPQFTTRNVELPPGAVIAADPLTGGAVPGNAIGSTSDSDIWRQIRQGNPGRVTIPDPHAAIMIRDSGEKWREIRAYWLPYYGAIPILGVLTALLLFYAIRGRIRIEGGRSGQTLPRFKLWHRTMHWFVACIFILLALSGLIILFGRVGLIPLIGKDAFSVFASAALQGHNLFGPIFVVVFFPMILMFLKGNGFNWVDVKWVLKGGGLLGGHASSEKNNFGEKGWYWLLVLGGTVLCVSGVMLDFPWLVEITGVLTIAHVAHALAAIALISVALGHIYIGSLGMEGALEGMTKGEVDVNWARQHHDLWAEQLLGEEHTDETGKDGKGVPVPAE